MNAIGMPLLLLLALISLALVVGIVVVIFFYRRRPIAINDTDLSLKKIDVASLPDRGPTGLIPQLTLYHQPVRLALIVIAPVGRDNRLPNTSKMPEVVEALLPGLMRVMSAHQPEYQPWPAQLSVGGFMGHFAACVPLPGRHGKGTPWSSITGPFEYDGQRYLAGLVVRSAMANSVGELTVEHQGAWLDMLRVV